MKIEQQELENLIKETVKATILELGLDKHPPKKERSAYNKTEQLLYNYNNFKRVVKEKLEQINEIKKYGVPHKGGAVHTYAGGNTVHGLATVDETVDNAVHTVQVSVQGIVDVINMINEAMQGIKNDPWYPILEMRYFDGMGQDDIAKAMNCTQPNVSYHKSRLVKELAVRIFPDEIVKEMME